MNTINDIPTRSKFRFRTLLAVMMMAAWNIEVVKFRQVALGAPPYIHGAEMWDCSCF